MRRSLGLIALASAFICAAASAAPDRAAIEAAVAAPTRSAENRARDVYRHPADTLAFFGIRPDMRVVEIWPGGAGWYTEILAPLLKNDGHLTVAIPGDQVDQFREAILAANERFLRTLESDPATYGRVRVTSLWAPGQVDIAEPGSADAVLTFRNFHNWMRWGQVEATLAAIHRALRPGGILGITDHRSPADKPVDPEARNGYVNQAHAIELIQAAGFEFVGSSEVNANPKDTADHPRGVWTLPPTLMLGDQDRETYVAIGESDRFTLLFRKP